MDKLKFMAKCLLVMLPVICLIGYARVRTLSYYDGEAPAYVWNREYCNTHHDKEIRNIILGDSTASASYMPEVLSDETVNLSLGGASTMEIYYTMVEWLKNNKPPKDVFISLVDGHFNSASTFWGRTMYSHRYSLEDSWSMLQAAIDYEEPSMVKGNYYWDFLSYELYLPNKYMVSVANAGINRRYEGNKKSMTLQGIHGGRYIARGTHEVKIDGVIVHKGFKVKPLFDDYYKKLIRLCLDNNIRVHIIKLPLPDQNSYTESHIQEFWAYYRELQREFPEITVEWPEKNYEKYYFADRSHANNHGAFRFSMWLRSRYPELFSDKLSGNQVAAINDNISIENYFLELCKWVTFEPYIMLIHDGTGRFQEIYEKDMGIISATAGFENRKLKLERLKALGADYYIVSPTEEGLTFSSIKPKDKSIMVYPKGLGVGKNKFEWKVFGVNIIDALVIDRRNGKVVTAKKFYYNDNGNLIIQSK